jgi:lantibiotic leader peptide-processing serine protease
VCGYYFATQGTSMAAPHATGVAALIISRWGTPDRNRSDGLTLAPIRTEIILKRSAHDRACPAGGVLAYPDLPDVFTATCAGNPRFNGFYGHGIVNAMAAVADATAGVKRGLRSTVGRAQAR